jgi:hypothetical protein
MTVLEDRLLIALSALQDKSAPDDPVRPASASDTHGTGSA